MSEKRDFEAITYKEALKVCLKIDKQVVCDFAVNFKHLGVLMLIGDEYIFHPISHEGNLIEASAQKEV